MPKLGKLMARLSPVNNYARAFSRVAIWSARNWSPGDCWRVVRAQIPLAPPTSRSPVMIRPMIETSALCVEGRPGPDDPSLRFFNLRAQWYQHVADLLQRDALDGLRDATTIGELAGIRLTEDEGSDAWRPADCISATVEILKQRFLWPVPTWCQRIRVLCAYGFRGYLRKRRSAPARRVPDPLLDAMHGEAHGAASARIQGEARGYRQARGGGTAHGTLCA
jgi:hypothetical protein